MSVVSRFKSPRVAILLLSLLALPIYAACTEVDNKTRESATRGFYIGNNTLSVTNSPGLPVNIINSGTNINATITSQAGWGLSNGSLLPEGPLAWATGGLQPSENTFYQDTNIIIDGSSGPESLPVQNRYDVLAYCELINSSAAVVKNNLKGQGWNGALENQAPNGSGGTIYTKSGAPNDVAPNANSFCDLSLSGLADGTYTLRFGKGRAWKSVLTKNSTEYISYYIDRQEGRAATQQIILDRSAPVGGSLAGPESTGESSFTVTVTPFTDPHSGMSIQTLERRWAPLLTSGASNICPPSNEAGWWSPWIGIATNPEVSFAQNNMDRGCWQYRLKGTNRALFNSTSSVLTVKTTTTIPDNPDPDPEPEPAGPASMRILSATGPERIKKGKKATYTLRIRNTSENRAREVSARAIGSGVASAKIQLGTMQAGSTQKISVPILFQKKGKIRVVFAVSGEDHRTATQVKFVRVRK